MSSPKYLFDLFQSILTQLRTIFDLVIQFQTVQDNMYQSANDEVNLRQMFDDKKVQLTQKVGHNLSLPSYPPFSSFLLLPPPFSSPPFSSPPFSSFLLPPLLPCIRVCVLFFFTIHDCFLGRNKVALSGEFHFRVFVLFSEKSVF